MRVVMQKGCQLNAMPVSLVVICKKKGIKLVIKEKKQLCLALQLEGINTIEVIQSLGFMQ